MDEIIEKLNEIGTELYEKCGSQSYGARCKLHDVRKQLKALPIHIVTHSKPTYKTKNQLPDDVKYLFHKGVDLYQAIMNYENGIIGPEEFAEDMRKAEKAYCG